MVTVHLHSIAAFEKVESRTVSKMVIVFEKVEGKELQSCEPSGSCGVGSRPQSILRVALRPRKEWVREGGHYLLSPCFLVAKLSVELSPCLKRWRVLQLNKRG